MAKRKAEQIQLPKPEGFDTMTATEKEEQSALVRAGPLVGNASVLSSFTGHVSMSGNNNTPGGLLLEALTAIQGTVRRVKAGDMSDMEAMLAAQAMTLGKMFESTALRAQMNIADYPQAARDWMQLALKAQAACRATVEALSEVKNPRSATFIRAGQANVTSGPQQVNNSEMPAIPRALPGPAPEILAIPVNELLKVRNE